MPLQIKQSLSKQPTFIILPFVKDQVDFDLIREITGLKYNPDITFGPKDVHTFYHPEKQLKIIILGLGETKDAGKVDFYFRSIILFSMPFLTGVWCENHQSHSSTLNQN